MNSKGGMLFDFTPMLRRPFWLLKERLVKAIPMVWAVDLKPEISTIWVDFWLVACQPGIVVENTDASPLY